MANGEVPLIRRWTDAISEIPENDGIQNYFAWITFFSLVICSDYFAICSGFKN